jgi:hypothetical protein
MIVYEPESTFFVFRKTFVLDAHCVIFVSASLSAVLC